MARPPLGEKVNMFGAEGMSAKPYRDIASFAGQLYGSRYEKVKELIPKIRAEMGPYASSDDVAKEAHRRAEKEITGLVASEEALRKAIKDAPDPYPTDALDPSELSDEALWRRLAADAPIHRVSAILNGALNKDEQAKLAELRDPTKPKSVLGWLGEGLRRETEAIQQTLLGGVARTATEAQRFERGEQPTELGTPSGEVGQSATKGQQLTFLGAQPHNWLKAIVAGLGKDTGAEVGSDFMTGLRRERPRPGEPSGIVAQIGRQAAESIAMKAKDDAIKLGVDPQKLTEKRMKDEGFESYLRNPEIVQLIASIITPSPTTVGAIGAARGAVVGGREAIRAEKLGKATDILSNIVEQEKVADKVTDLEKILAGEKPVPFDYVPAARTEALGEIEFRQAEAAKARAALEPVTTQARSENINELLTSKAEQIRGMEDSKGLNKSLIYGEVPKSGLEGSLGERKLQGFAKTPNEFTQPINVGKAEQVAYNVAKDNLAGKVNASLESLAAHHEKVARDLEKGLADLPTLDKAKLELDILKAKEQGRALSAKFAELSPLERQLPEAKVAALKLITEAVTPKLEGLGDVAKNPLAAFEQVWDYMPELQRAVAAAKPEFKGAIEQLGSDIRHSIDIGDVEAVQHWEPLRKALDDFKAATSGLSKQERELLYDAAIGEEHFAALHPEYVQPNGEIVMPVGYDAFHAEVQALEEAHMQGRIASGEGKFWGKPVPGSKEDVLQPATAKTLENYVPQVAENPLFKAEKEFKATPTVQHGGPGQTDLVTGGEKERTIFKTEEIKRRYVSDVATQFETELANRQHSSEQLSKVKNITESAQRAGRWVEVEAGHAPVFYAKVAEAETAKTGIKHVVLDDTATDVAQRIAGVPGEVVRGANKVVVPEFVAKPIVDAVSIYSGAKKADEAGKISRTVGDYVFKPLKTSFQNMALSTDAFLIGQCAANPMLHFVGGGLSAMNPELQGMAALGSLANLMSRDAKVVERVRDLKFVTKAGKEIKLGDALDAFDKDTHWGAVFGARMQYEGRHGKGVGSLLSIGVEAWTERLVPGVPVVPLGFGPLRAVTTKTLAGEAERLQHFLPYIGALDDLSFGSRSKALDAMSEIANNYNRLSPTLKAVGREYIPFFTFAKYSMDLLARTAIEHPSRIIPFIQQRQHNALTRLQLSQSAAPQWGHSFVAAEEQRSEEHTSE